MSKELVSIIIPAYNEAKVLPRLLESVKTQSYKNIETIVVDDASTDDTAKIARGFTKKVFTRKHAERSKQRNFGALKSKGDYLLFLDADMKLTQNVIAEAITLMRKHKDLGAVAIPETSVANTFWENVKAYERSFYNKHGDPTTDAARFFTKKAFYKVGGYDETITGPEDWDLPERIVIAGFKQQRIKSNIFHYEHVPNPLILAKKKYYYALTSYRYLKKHKIKAISGKTIYFMRPIFYKNWQTLISHPLLSSAMFIMFFFEQLGGGIGYLVGRFKKL